MLSSEHIGTTHVRPHRALQQHFYATHRIPPQEWQKGACGIGILARLDGQPSRRIIEDAIAAHGCLTHRGAETHRSHEDPGTSDGAGMMFLYNRNGALQAFLA
ncbi:MAG: hypothetical protein HYZ81_18365, partial [Nitrospinae bacterium]|nr:hypothetical protein [Nitrospinota bacterium]